MCVVFMILSTVYTASQCMQNQCSIRTVKRFFEFRFLVFYHASQIQSHSTIDLLLTSFNLQSIRKYKKSLYNSERSTIYHNLPIASSTFTGPKILHKTSSFVATSSNGFQAHSQWKTSCMGISSFHRYHLHGEMVKQWLQNISLRVAHFLQIITECKKAYTVDALQKIEKDYHTNPDVEMWRPERTTQL